MSAPVTIIIPAFNQLEYCKQCLHSLLAHTDGDYKLVLVDNGSTDGVGEFFDTIPGATVLHPGKNLGFAGGINLGLREAEGHALLLNSDTLLPEGWLPVLRNALESDDTIGMVGPRSNNVSGPQLIEGLELATLDDITNCARRLAEENDGRLRDVTRLVGFCLLIRDEVWQDKVGLLDEQYGIGNFEDDDYCIRVLKEGYRLCIAEDAFVFHYGSRTFLGMGIMDDEWDTLLERNRHLFESKWNTAAAERHDQIQSARHLLRAAEVLLEGGDALAALRKCAEALHAAPTYECCYNDFGAILWHLGRREEAFQQFKRAVTINPRHEQSAQNLRDAAAALGREAEADKLFGSLL